MPKSSDIDRMFYDSHSEIEIDRKSIIEEDVKGWYFDSAGAHAAAHNTVIDFYSKSHNRSIAFKAIITSFSDNYSQTFKSDQVGYNVYRQKINYESRKRVINLSFDVVAASEKEAEHNLKRINELAIFCHDDKPPFNPAKTDSTGQKLMPSTPPGAGMDGNAVGLNQQAEEKTGNSTTNPQTAPPQPIMVKFANLISQSPKRDYADKKGGLECRISNLSYDFSTEHTYFKISGNTGPSARKNKTKNTIIAPSKVSVTLTMEVLDTEFGTKTKRVGPYGRGRFPEKSPDLKLPSGNSELNKDIRQSLKKILGN